MKSTLCQEQKAICKRVQVINLSFSRFQRENADVECREKFSRLLPPDADDFKNKTIPSMLREFKFQG